MLTKNAPRQERNPERGVGLLMIAAGMVLFLSAAGLAIDLVSAYVVRNEAQRVADAAALAGATVFINQGCTTTGGCVAGGPQEAEATTQAVAIAGQNLVLGQAPTSTTISTSFSYPNPNEPQITVTVYRDSAHSNAAPTFFATVFGLGSMNISASATAEAYNPSGGSTPIGVACLKPFLVPNCDPGHPVAASSLSANRNCPAVDGTVDGNGECPTTATNCQSYFYWPANTPGKTTGALLNPGLCTSWVVDSTGNTAGHCTAGGVIGEPWALHDNAGPSEWYQLQFAGESGSNLRQAIQECSFQIVACNQPLNALNGVKVGPTDQGVEALINASGNGGGEGQDYITCDPTVQSSCGTVPPFTMEGGSGNQNGMSGKQFQATTNSSSIVSVAMYEGCVNGTGIGTGLACQSLGGCPGNGCVVKVDGFMQLFVVDAQGPNGDGNTQCTTANQANCTPLGFSNSPKSVDAIVMAPGGCGSSTSTAPPVVSNGGAFIPIRLIHQ